MNNGFKHETPFSLQIRPFRNFSISPNVTYSGVLYSKKNSSLWDEEQEKVVTETDEGLLYGQAVNPSISASYNPQIFGMFTFTNPDSRLQAIRHVIKPSVSFNFIPYLPGLKF